MTDLYSRRGKLTVTKELLVDGDIKFIKALFGNFYPIHAEWDDTYGFGRDVIYYGFSEHFDVLEDGLMAAEYTAEVTQLESGDYSIRFIK